MILKRNAILICSMILPVLLCGCGMLTRNRNQIDMLNWKYGDLRILDNIDATQPYQDLIAIYTREINHNLQIRLDFLELEQFPGKDIFIAIDTNAGGKHQIDTRSHGNLTSEIDWDYLIEITNSGIVDLLDAQYVPVKNKDIFIIYDSEQDRIVINLNSAKIPIIFLQTKLQVIITPPDQSSIADQSAVFTLDTPSPSRLDVFVAFWNVFSAETPAQTLRAWAGAHSGPMSSRHGLSYLLDAASSTRIPILLADLNTPDNWSALDYLDELYKVEILINQGILLIPDNNKLVVDNDGLNSVSFLLLNSLFINNYMINKFGYIDYAHISNTDNGCSFTILSSQNITPSNNISLQCKKVFISSLLNYPPAPLILGGDFAQSMLGNPATALKLFTYIQAHPWMRLITKDDFRNSHDLSFLHMTPLIVSNEYLSLRSQQFYLSGMYPIEDKIYEALLISPRNQLTNIAWKVFADLTRSASTNLMSLRSAYIGQIGNLLVAAKWAQNPSRQATCNTDLDYDGSNECVLATKKLLAIIEPVGGYISFLFSLNSAGVHQLIGPTWEFAVGLSDVSTWKPELGVRADSNQLLGAFQDSVGNWNNYQAEVFNDYIVLTSDISSTQKRLTILSESLQISISKPVISQASDLIPLVIDPWIRYQPNWGDLYIKDLEMNTLTWGIASGEKISIHSSNGLDFYAFNDSHYALASPEDPNFDYGKGHFLPFPMALAEIRPSETYTVEISFSP